jgi:hypothetical protein
MRELREAFVRARFAQDDVFGRPDIEELLARQRKAEKPVEHTWRRLIDTGRVQRPFHIRELPDLAVPQELPREFSIRQMADVGDPLVAMLCESVDRRRVDVFPANERLTLFLLKGDDGAPAHAFTLTPQHNQKRRSGDPLAYTLFVPSDKDLLQIVLSRGWSVGTKKIVTAARRLLCDGLATCIKEERAKAEHDFDTAVAVSANGTKIVHADYVVVAESTGAYEARAVIYPASAFREKLLRSPRMGREPHPGGTGMPDKCYTDDTAHITYALSHPGDPLNTRGSLGHELSPYNHSGHRGSLQRLVEYWMRDRRREMLIRRFLLTTRDFCPSPLPDGGVEVTA